MIGKLRGVVDSISEEGVVIDVGGVGYIAFCSPRTMGMLTVGKPAQLITEMHVREDHIHLFGFADIIERDWFRLLATVQGVGNKIALAILGAYAPPQLAHAIMARDIAAFKAISGVGPKLAERIVTELKDKVTKLPTSELRIVENTTGIKKKDAPAKNIAPLEDAISALVNLGYTRSEAYGAVLKANEEGQQELDGLIKTGLKQLVRK
jgi:Holliday junction DNA helicase RuvA